MLFSICKYKKFSFDPMMLGVFLDKIEAEKSKELLKNSGNYIAFVLEMPLATTSEDWMTYAKDYLIKITKSSFVDKKNDKVPIHIIRRKSERRIIKTLSDRGNQLAEKTE